MEMRRLGASGPQVSALSFGTMTFGGNDNPSSVGTTQVDDARRPNDLGQSRHHIIRGCEASLKRLGTDYIDPYQAHGFDSLTPLEETLLTYPYWHRMP